MQAFVEEHQKKTSGGLSLRDENAQLRETNERLMREINQLKSQILQGSTLSTFASIPDVDADPEIDAILEAEGLAFAVPRKKVEEAPADIPAAPAESTAPAEEEAQAEPPAPSGEEVPAESTPAPSGEEVPAESAAPAEPAASPLEEAPAESTPAESAAPAAEESSVSTPADAAAPAESAVAPQGPT